MFGSDERSEVGTTIPVQKLTLAQRLRRHWPQSLGTAGKDGDNWTFITNGGTSLSLQWYFYNDGVNLSRERDNRMALFYCEICIHVVRLKLSQIASRTRGRGPFG